MIAIAAMAENRAIGKQGKLPWAPIKEDFRFFKEFTMDKILLVGKNTFDTLPLLKGRECICIDQRSPFNPAIVENASGMSAINVDMNYIIKLYERNKHFVMYKYVIAGGAKTYERFLPYITEFYITHVKGEYEADTFMPAFEHLYNKQEVVKEFDGHKVIKYSR